MKIAFITSRFPFPIEKGDKLRAYQHIRWLGERHELHLFAITHQEITTHDIDAVQAFCAGVRIYPISRFKLPLNILTGWLDGLPAQVAYFLDGKQKRLMQQEVIKLQPEHIFVQLIRAVEYVRVLPIRKTLDYMDVFSHGSAQRARSGAWLLRPFFALEAARLRKYEKAVYNDFTNHVIISAQDRDRLPLPYQTSVTVLSNGVDLDYYTPAEKQEPAYDVVFVGNLGYVPNIEAAELLVRKIMPKVWTKFPAARVCLVGARPHRRVQRLKSERVVVTGWVEDVRPYYTKGRIFVAPMFSGMGQQNKILEAMSMRRPCITTALVDKAIGASAANALLTAENPETFAAAICRLMADPDQALALAVTAREFILQNYSWESKNQSLDSLLSKRNHSQTVNV